MLKQTDLIMSDRQKEIVDVALQLIAEEGIQGLTIKNLAKKIGFSESAIYRHFESKTEILLALLDFFKEITTQLFAEQLQSNESSLVKIENLFMAHFSKFTQTPSLVSVIFSEDIFRNEEALSNKVAEIVNRNVVGLKTILTEGQQKGEINNAIDSTHLSVIILGSLRMFIKQWHMKNYSFDLMEKGAAFTDSIKTLIRP
jgi:AcrR family transcriptional regulator